MPSTAGSLETDKILERKLSPRYCPPENPMGCPGRGGWGLAELQEKGGELRAVLEEGSSQKAGWGGFVEGRLLCQTLEASRRHTVGGHFKD